jgi:hypothetical protein
MSVPSTPELAALWRARYRGYARAFRRRPSACRRIVDVAARLDRRARLRPLTPPEGRLRAMFVPWDRIRAQCEAFVRRLFLIH